MNFLWANLKEKYIKIIKNWMSQDYSKSKVTELAKSLGLKVIYIDERESFSGYFERETTPPTIYVNNNHSKTRKRFTIAHEIAHFVLGHSSAARDRSKKYERISEEYMANGLAAEILMPKEEIIKLHAKYYNKNIDELVSIMSEHFQVSKTAMLVRLNMFFGMNYKIV